MSLVIKAENISKQYKLGMVGMANLTDDVQRLIAKIRGKDDPLLKVGETNDRTSKGSSDYVWALRDVNFEVNQGEVVGVIGRNGAGKSTLLKILSRVTEPTLGRLKFKGKMASLLEVGTGFHPELSGRDNIYLNGAILGMSRSEISGKLDEIINFSGVERYIDTPVKRYSSGMYVRLAFAVAAHLESDILILDEVLAVGDGDFQKKCLGKIKDVSGSGRTVLFVSHSMLAVKSLCNKGILMHQGTIQKIGNIDEVINAYAQNGSSNKSSLVEINKSAQGLTLKSINVSNNGSAGNFEIDEDLTFETLLFSEQVKPNINLNIFFKSVEGIDIFATCSEQVSLKEGKNVFTCVVPKRFLNDNLYTISIMLVENGEKALFDLNEVMAIEGVEKKRDGSWLGKFPGLVRPQDFKWTVTN